MLERTFAQLEKADTHTAVEGLQRCYVVAPRLSIVEHPRRSSTCDAAIPGLIFNRRKACTSAQAQSTASG
jgi:hypothetical protein